VSPARGRPTPRGAGAATGAKAPTPDGPDVAAFDRFIRSLGIDPARDPEYAETAERAAQFLADRTAGLRASPRPLQTIRHRGREGETVALEEIPIYGLCPHHLTPYFGTATVRYAPGALACGAGSLARLVRELALVPRIQENLTQAIADQVQRALDPRNVEVVVRARHFCLEMRGVEQRAELVTEARRGAPR
jgi:GTP cyclohydrolase IA